MRLTVTPSPWMRARPSRKWLRSHYRPVTAAALLLLALNEYDLHGTHLRDWDWLLVTGWTTFVLTLGVTFRLPDKVDEVLRRLAVSQVLDDGENRLDDFRCELHESSRRAARVGGVIVASALALGWIVAKRGALPYYLLTILLEMAGAFLAGTFIGRAVSYSRLGERLKRAGYTFNVDPEHLDGVAGLRPIGNLYFFQSALVAVPGVFLALWWFLIPFFGTRYSDFRGAYAGLLMFVLVCEVIAFLSPMWSFHRIMREGKDRFLAEADKISEQAARIQKQLRDGAEESAITSLEDKLGRLTKRYDAIINMSTWPVDKRIQHRFELNNLILFIPVVAQLLGTVSTWQHFLESLQKVFAGQG